ncbi:MAG: hypothetical protein QF690_04395, partial [Anaerolineales bacterium]|nr:hypothetical protein [Anaerolineales bacterium]
MGEKDGTGSIQSPEAVLFTLVGPVTAYPGVAPVFADRPLILQPVNATVPRTDAAFPEHFPGLGH